MTYMEALNVELGMPVYKKDLPEEQFLMTVTGKRVCSMQAAVVLQCDDGKEYIHRELHCYQMVR